MAIYLNCFLPFSIDTLTPADLATLVNELHEVRDVWFPLGVQLKVPLADLRSIRADYRDKSSDCLLEMLSTWLSSTAPPPTWQRVVDALCCASIDRHSVGYRIREIYCKQSPTSSGMYSIHNCIKMYRKNLLLQILVEHRMKC